MMTTWCLLPSMPLSTAICLRWKNVALRYVWIGKEKYKICIMPLVTKITRLSFNTVSMLKLVRNTSRYILSFECAFCQAALGRRSYIKRQRAALPPPTVTTPLSSTTPPDLFLHPFKGSRLNITALSASKPVTITEGKIERCTRCLLLIELWKIVLPDSPR